MQKVQDWAVADIEELEHELEQEHIEFLRGLDASEYDAQESFSAWRAMQEEAEEARMEAINARIDAGLEPF